MELIIDHPKFATLKVYGTKDEPLFPVSSVSHLLNCRIRTDKGAYELGLDYVRMVAPSKNGNILEQNMLTETGLYNVIFNTNNSLGREFRIFVTNLLKKLRHIGMVHIDDILVDMSSRLVIEDKVDHLYFITDGKWTKIGRSEDVYNRIKQLQTGNPLELTIKIVHNKMGKWESLVHMKAKNLCVHRGEWFKLSTEEYDNLQLFIANL